MRHEKSEIRERIKQSEQLNAFISMNYEQTKEDLREIQKKMRSLF